MTRPKHNKTDSEPADAPAPKTFKNVGIPRKLWEQLDQIRVEEDRSVNWLVKRAVEQFLERRRQRNNGTP